MNYPPKKNTQNKTIKSQPIHTNTIDRSINQSLIDWKINQSINQTLIHVYHAFNASVRQSSVISEWLYPSEIYQSALLHPVAAEPCGPVAHPLFLLCGTLLALLFFFLLVTAVISHVGGLHVGEKKLGTQKKKMYQNCSAAADSISSTSQSLDSPTHSEFTSLKPREQSPTANGQGSQGLPQARPKVEQHSSLRMAPMMSASHCPWTTWVQHVAIRLSVAMI